MKPIRKGIFLLASYYEAIEDFESEEMRQEFIYAVYKYGITGQVPVFSIPHMRSVWKAIRPVIDNGLKKNDAQTQNGRKGGRPSKTQQKPKTNQEYEYDE